MTRGKIDKSVQRQWPEKKRETKKVPTGNALCVCVYGGILIKEFCAVKLLLPPRLTECTHAQGLRWG